MNLARPAPYLAGLARCKLLLESLGAVLRRQAWLRSEPLCANRPGLHGGLVVPETHDRR